MKKFVILCLTLWQLAGRLKRLFIDSKTHLPLMLSWSTPPNLVPVVAGQKPPANLAPDDQVEKSKIKQCPYRTTSGFSVVGEPLFSNQSMPSLTRSNFRR